MNALFNTLFDDFGFDGYTMPSINVKKALQTPKVDVKENEAAYTLEMDLPGKTEKDLKIELNKNVLTISSEEETKTEESSEAEKKEECKWLIRERSCTKFSRSFSLPEDVDGEQLSATVKNGVLSVIMPRKAITAPRRIQISCGA
ncbi:MAG: Hsp20/alpha crystallin family protein [Treponema sp.]|nr:Hsp20/alpha crystallin family protein [Candidatus Treponema equifaecale]